jgi:dihydrolipoamide dehydrogenase
MNTSSNLAIIGGGPGGYVAAIRAAQCGLSVTLIEKEPTLGGICLNHGCIPSKALIHAAEVFDQTKSGAKIGILADNIRVDFAKVQAFKARVVKKLTLGVKNLLQGNGVTILYGQARFLDSNRIEVTSENGTDVVEAENVILATGAKPYALPFLPFDGQTVLSSREALSLDEIPERLLVIGGGIIGTELGQAYAKFGSQVTIVEALDSLLPSLPGDCVEPLTKILRRLRVKIHTGAKAGEAIVGDGLAKVKVRLADGTEQTIEADKVLVTIGLKPNVFGIGLSNTKVTTDDHGFVLIDHACQTDDPAIFAIGDVTGEPLLAHKASAQGIVAAEHCAGKEGSLDLQTVPGVVYTDPEIATVGLTLDQAEKIGRKVLVGKYSFAGHGRAATMNKPEGFVKMIADEESHTLLGVQIVGAGAGELIGEAVLALSNTMTVGDLGTLVHPHPTLSEAITEAAEDTLGCAIHSMKK